mmetsp:Transcript_11507/g.70773  ORF Transcript_11507/g.70773 Transcript_11507/m.70773 type:complete len:200 (-) Transcript_11507:1555-2154(-)
MELGGSVRVERAVGWRPFGTRRASGARMVRQALSARRRSLRQGAVRRRRGTSATRRGKAAARAALSTSRHPGMHVPDESAPRRRRCADGVREREARGSQRGARAGKDVHLAAWRHRTRRSLLSTRHAARTHLGRASQGMPALVVELRRSTAQSQGQESKRIPGEEAKEDEKRRSSARQLIPCHHQDQCRYLGDPQLRLP